MIPQISFWSESRRKQRLCIELMRDATFAERFDMCRQMTSFVITKVREDIAREHPDLTQEERKLKFVETVYGQEIADGVRRDIRRRESAHTQ